MKKINHLIQFIIIKIFFIIFGIIGYKASSNLGFIIGKYLGPIFRSKELIINNLEKANIDKKNNFEKNSFKCSWKLWKNIFRICTFKKF